MKFLNLCWKDIKRERDVPNIFILQQDFTPSTACLTTMKSFTVIALFIAHLLGVFCSNVASTPFRGGARELCPSAIVTNSTTINVNGNAIQRLTFECPNDDLSARAEVSSLAERSPVSIPNTLTDLARRNAAECKTTGTECQCGQPTSCACTNPTPNAPTGNDCAVLIDSLQVIPQLVGPTFVVHSRTFQLLQFQSCAIEWSNLVGGLRDQPLEYCWDEVVALTGLCNQVCLENNAGSGASCSPDDGLWKLQMFRISS